MFCFFSLSLWIMWHSNMSSSTNKDCICFQATSVWSLDFWLVLMCKKNHSSVKLLYSLICHSRWTKSATNYLESCQSLVICESQDDPDSSLNAVIRQLKETPRFLILPSGYGSKTQRTGVDSLWVLLDTDPRSHRAHMWGGGNAW